MAFRHSCLRDLSVIYICCLFVCLFASKKKKKKEEEEEEEKKEDDEEEERSLKEKKEGNKLNSIFHDSAADKIQILFKSAL